VYALDVATPQRTDLANVEIGVDFSEVHTLDWRNRPYERTITENDKIGTQVISVQAVDKTSTKVSIFFLVSFI
jgi:hypothetical protein